MRGIERALAGLLLAGALAATTVFARHAGGDPQAAAVRFQAPPSHLSAGAPVVVPLPAPARRVKVVATEVAAAPAVVLTAPKQIAVTRRLHVAPVARPPTARAHVQPAPKPDPTRLIASNVSTRTTPVLAAAPERGRGNGHAYGHFKHIEAQVADDEDSTPIPSSPQDDQGRKPDWNRGRGQDHQDD